MNRSFRFLAPLLLVLLSACATLPAPAPAPTASAPEAAIAAPAQSPPPRPAPPPPPPALPRPHALFAEHLAEPECAGVTAAQAGPFTPRHVLRVLGERGDVFNFVVQQLVESGLPSEFAVLPIIESAYRPDPGNRGDVRGLWQFSTGTARRFGLRTGMPIEERLSAVHSTRAALHHLGEMWQRWNDWRLSMIGYNAGEYAVTLALRKHSGATVHWSKLRLPQRSVTYTHRAHALACLIAHSEDIARVLDDWGERPLRIASGWKGGAGLDGISAALDVPLERLLLLNPLLRSQQWPALREQPLLLPQSALPRLAAVAEVPPPPASPARAESEREYRVEAGDSLWRIARRFGVSVAQLQRWNGLNSKSTLRIGQRIRLAP